MEVIVMEGVFRVLFLCTANSARSQMAEAVLRKLGGKDYEVFSAGIEATRVNPFTTQVMEEAGYDLSKHTSKSLDQFLGLKFDYVITVCSDAEDRCPFFPGAVRRLHWPFEDPAVGDGELAEKLQRFRHARDLITAQIAGWLAERQGQASPQGI